MKEIILHKRKGIKAIVDDDTYEEISKYKWYIEHGKEPAKPYAIRSSMIKGKQHHVRLHRQIMGLSKGDGVKVDHINGDSLDNRKSNLRIATSAQNSQNARKYSVNTSGYKGVTWSKNRSKWQAQTSFLGRTLYIGYFKDKEEAAIAYYRKTKELFGEFVNKDVEKIALELIVSHGMST